MKRSTFIRILKTIKQVSNNVSVIENFNCKALVVFKLPCIIGETPLQQKAFRKLMAHPTYFRIAPENGELEITVEFDLD
ncbi:MAG: hypothetical protein P4N59_23250 [Negativicutes bacterium]|nr:hypothetical protein [Negativicutes bacterium]